MSRLDWKEHTRGHWDADHCGVCLHVFKSLNGSCWSVYDQAIEIDGRGAMMPFEKAQASAVAAAERWSGNAHFTAVRETFRVLDARGQAPDDNAPLEVTVRRVLDLLDKVTAERDALKKRVADADVIRVHACMSNGIARYLTPQTNVSEPGRYALLRLEKDEQ